MEFPFHPREDPLKSFDRAERNVVDARASQWPPLTRPPESDEEDKEELEEEQEEGKMVGEENKEEQEEEQDVGKMVGAWPGSPHLLKESFRICQRPLRGFHRSLLAFLLVLGSVPCSHRYDNFLILIPSS